MNKIRRCFGTALIILLSLSVISYSSSYFFYRVKRGDTISGVAGEFNLSTEELLSLNQISDPDLIFAGQALRLPVDRTEYRVKEGDSLWEIARDYNLEIEDIIAGNQLEDQDLIKIGQVISLPADPERVRYTLAARAAQINFVWPTQGRISSKYGWRIHPIKKEREFHAGLDIAVALGSPVYAAESGAIIFSGYTEGYGNLVIIEHRDNYRSYYAHNFKILVEEGETVRQGKIIALSGSSGLSTGPHLHFEIRIERRSVDPLGFLNQRYLRLVSSPGF